MSSDRRLRVGMIGTGMVGQVAHLANLASRHDVEVVALAELRPNLRALVAERHRIPKTYATHEELLADRAIEAVVVVTRRPATAPIVRDALRAGKHVLSEKPMAHTVAQAEQLIAERRGGQQYVVGFMKRFDAGIELARERITEYLRTGEHGALQMARAWSLGGDAMLRFDGWVMTDEPRPEGLELWADAPDWLDAAQASRYADFVNVQIHTINLLRHLLPDELSVCSATLSASAQAGTAAFRAGSVPVAFDFAAHSTGPWREGVELHFEKATLAIDLPAPMLRNDCARVQLTTPAGVQLWSVPPSWAFSRQAEGFVAACLGTDTTRADAEDCLGDLVVVEEMWRKAAFA